MMLIFINIYEIFLHEYPPHYYGAGVVGVMMLMVVIADMQLVKILKSQLTP